MKELLVTKYGSGIVTNGEGISQSYINGYAEQLACVRDRFDLIVVTSGAVAAGRCMWNGQEREEDQPEPSLQALASLGSSRIFMAWQNAFGRLGMLAGAVSVTHREIDDTSEGPMLLKGLHDNRTSGIVTVLNENDAISDVELAKLAYGGENDGLASHIARVTKASSLILFNSVGGLLDDSGRNMPVIEPHDYDSVLEMARARKPSLVGRGGLHTKVLALIDAAKAGVDAYVAKADAPIADVLTGQSGTHVRWSSKAGKSITIAGETIETLS